ncbi:General transcription factor IIH subunit 2 [Frankliniella fusca]|uniref:General transcription factor IIH subunit n=1 Tax=Frankliniella fusca TaxID=407009 RepID=A0AAE1LTV6_9NEOP|nr:General transcription factor IIH subunit 2 [Frankliniella fusca]
MAEEEEGNEYRWETGYEKTWEAIKEDDDGLLEASVAEIIQRAKRKRQAERRPNTRLGMMRHLYIILDCSDAMTDQDLKPTRQLCTAKLLEGFIEEYFDQNPISQMGIIVTRNKRAELVCELAGNVRKHVDIVKQIAQGPCSGEPSLQNSLELALSSLRLLPGHASREVLIIMGSLTTCDPHDINVTIQKLKAEGVRCSVIGLAAEVRVCRQLSKETGGLYSVILDDCHFRDLLLQQVEPPPAARTQDCSLVRMGFPHHSKIGNDAVDGGSTSNSNAMSFCMCHLDVEGKVDSSKLGATGHLCPQCGSKYCELPVECRACGLTLVSAPHLARSYHHLFPVDNFLELDAKENVKPNCFGCRRKFVDIDKHVYKCGACSHIFCLDCDIFVHDTLHSCPGCTSTAKGVK